MSSSFTATPDRYTLLNRIACLDRRERRRDIRFPVDVAVRVKILRDDFPEISARLCNISKRGLALLLSMEAHRGTRLEVRFQDLIVFAQVRHCRVADDGNFVLGTQIEHVWSMRTGSFISIASEE